MFVLCCRLVVVSRRLFVFVFVCLCWLFVVVAFFKVSLLFVLVCCCLSLFVVGCCALSFVECCCLLHVDVYSCSSFVARRRLSWVVFRCLALFVVLGWLLFVYH